jgi:glycosyltransferase involved in cell wall biosynthesis
MKPTVSIITATLNARAALEQTLQSVDVQTYAPVEHIVVDGNSKDGTLDLLKERDDAVDRWISEEDSGPYDAMNKGLGLASGEYVWFLNAGDTIAAHDALERIMEEASGADFIYGYAERIDARGRPRPWHKFTPKAVEVSPRSFIKGMVICHQAMLVRRAIAPRYDTRWSVSADIDWAIRCLHRTARVCNAETLVCRFLDGGISTTRRLKGWAERFDILNRHFGLLPTLWSHMEILAGKARRMPAE